MSSGGRSAHPITTIRVQIVLEDGCCKDRAQNIISTYYSAYLDSKEMHKISVKNCFFCCELNDIQNKKIFKKIIVM